MTGERFRRARDLFDRALDLPTQQRRAFLEGECSGDRELLDEVVSLLDNWRDDDELLDKPAASKVRDPMEGRQAGPYKMVRRIGRGGMGSVYLAVRADEQFRRRVAVKLVHPGFDDGQILARFENERNTLAVLDHPYIVKLLDAGTTEDGLPYLVMDYIDGESADDYCDRNRLVTDARLQLFRKLCAAVHYAHQNLVVHRDLKPSNIIVTPAGEPRLLDFGIAKLLRPEFGAAQMGLTRTRFQPMTPEYASPEQVEGRPVTTASDIYALGVILYRLLTGHHPYEGRMNTAADIERAIRDVDPERPSSLTRRGGPRPSTADRKTAEPPKIGADLDMIVLTAMAKEPRRRYASADHLSEDIARYLDGRPVLARDQTTGYKLRKFASRHRTPVMAGAVAVMALIAATFVSLWSAGVARRERDRAEQRLADVRKFTRVVFELDDAARSGSTAARQRAVSQTLDSLNRLAGEESADPAARSDLVENYLRVGDLQGNPYVPNLGDTEGARRSFERAFRLATDSLQRAPESPVARRDLARASLKLGESTATGGDQVKALKLYTDARDALTALAAADPANLDIRRDLLNALDKMGTAHYHLDDLPRAIDCYRRYVDTARSMPVSEEAALALARGEAKTGEILFRSGQREEGLRRLESGFAGMSEIAARSPANAAASRSVAATANIVGDILASLKRLPEADQAATRGLASLDALILRDPENRQYRRDRALATAFLSEIRRRRGLDASSRMLMETALAGLRELAARPSAPWPDHKDYAWFLLNAPAGLRNPDEALRNAEAAVSKSGGTDPSSLFTHALACDATGQRSRAIESARRALDRLPPGGSSHTKEEIAAALRTWESAAATPAPR
jgi:serine/threonine protein kinase/tetratricopeptide (TPR) repeat protein